MKIIKALAISLALTSNAYATSYYDEIGVVAQRCNPLCAELRQAYEDNNFIKIIGISALINEQCQLLTNHDPNWCQI